MSNYSDIFTGLKTVLEANVTGLKAYEHPPESVNSFPAAILLPDPIDVRLFFGGNSFEAKIRIVTLVSAGDSPEGWAQLMDYIDPTTTNKSIVKAVRTDPKLDGKVDSSEIYLIDNIGRREWFGGYYFGFDAHLEVSKTVA